MDEYTSEIMMGGHNTLVIHNTCEDSLLASPIILDLVILTEICQRITFRGPTQTTYQPFHSVLSILSYLCKVCLLFTFRLLWHLSFILHFPTQAPLVPEGAPVINSLNRQRSCIENIFRACLALPPVNHMMIEHRLAKPIHASSPTVAAKGEIKLPGGLESPTKSKPYVNGISQITEGVNGL